MKKFASVVATSLAFADFGEAFFNRKQETQESSGEVADKTSFKVPLTYKKGGINKYAKPESERSIYLNELRKQWGGGVIEMVANMWHKVLYGNTIPTTPTFNI